MLVTRNATTGSFLFSISFSLLDIVENCACTCLRSTIAISDGYGCAIILVFKHYQKDDVIDSDILYKTLPLPLHTRGPKTYLILLIGVKAPP